MRSKKTMSVIRTIIILSALVLVSCEKETPGTDEVFLEGSKFNPATITVTTGTTVTWTNHDNTIHSVTSDTGLFESGEMNNGATFTFTFATPGTYNLHCRFHAGMTGTVIVE